MPALPKGYLTVVFWLADFALLQLFFYVVKVAVDFAVGLLDVVTKVLADRCLQVDLVLYPVFVKAVFQAACIGPGALRRRAGVYLGTGFFRRQPCLPDLAHFVGNLEVADNSATLFAATRLW